MKIIDKPILQFISNSGIKLNLTKDKKYKIQVNDIKNKIKDKLVFESLNLSLSISHFNKLVTYFTKKIKE